MCFGVYFEIILNIKWLFSCGNNYIKYSYTHILGGSDNQWHMLAPPRTF